MTSPIVDRLRLQLQGSLPCVCGGIFVDQADVPLDVRYSAEWCATPRALKCNTCNIEQCSSCGASGEDRHATTATCPLATVFSAAVACELLRRVQQGLDKGWRDVIAPSAVDSVHVVPAHVSVGLATGSSASAAKPGSSAMPAKPSSWKCEICEHTNDIASDACVMCTVIRPGGIAALPSSVAAGWTCPVCLSYSTDLTAIACGACTVLRSTATLPPDANTAAAPPSPPVVAIPAPALPAPASVASPTPAQVAEVTAMDESAPTAAVTNIDTPAVVADGVVAPAPAPAPAETAAQEQSDSQLGAPKHTRRRSPKEVMAAVAQLVGPETLATLLSGMGVSGDGDEDIALSLLISVGELATESLWAIQTEEIPMTAAEVAAAAAAPTASSAAADAAAAQVRASLCSRNHLLLRRPATPPLYDAVQLRR